MIASVLVSQKPPARPRLLPAQLAQHAWSATALPTGSAGLTVPLYRTSPPPPVICEYRFTDKGLQPTLEFRVPFQRKRGGDDEPHASSYIGLSALLLAGLGSSPISGSSPRCALSLSRFVGCAQTGAVRASRGAASRSPL